MDSNVRSGGSRSRGTSRQDPARIAVFIHSLSGGGAQRRTVTLANGFAARGHHVDLVLITAHGPLRDQVAANVHVVALVNRRATRLLSPFPRRVQLMLAIPALARWLRCERPQVLLSAASHVHLPLLWAHRLARCDVAVVLRVSNHMSRSKMAGEAHGRLVAPFLARRFFPRADAVIAVSRGVAEDVTLTTGYPSERITTIYSPIVTQELRERARADLDHPWFRPDTLPVVLGVGRLVRQKDFPTLIRAFAHVRAVRPARLVILGRAKKNRRRRDLERLIDEIGVAGDVEIAGYVANPLPYMRESAVLVLSSAWEGLPGALIEALACGCPVVSTDCPSGPEEILDGGRYGRLVAVGDHAAMAKAILETLDASPARDSLRARADAFDACRSIDSYLDVLLGVARQRGGRRSSVPATVRRP